ncbi:MAG: hypothetical protein ACRBN8_13120 [Nannocystales bacterium]
MPLTKSAALFTVLVLLSACTQVRPDGFDGVGSDTDAPSASSDASTSSSGVVGSTGDASTSSVESSGDDSSTGAPFGDCVSIVQSTDIEERPADIILIADNSVSRELVQDQVTNLLPGMESVDVFDANVVLLFDGDPPPPSGKEGCGEWACRGASQYSSVYEEYETSIPPGGILSAVLTTHAQWSESLRPNSWKHIWITTTTAAETDLTNTDFRNQLRARLADLGMDDDVFIHTHAAQSGLSTDPSGYFGLADGSEGHTEFEDLDFFEFQNAVVDRIKGTALACEFEIPPPPDGLAFDRDRVNVIYDAGQGANPIGYVDSLGACKQFGYGWYYDDPLQPTEIRMCPLSCEQFDQLSNSTIDIQFGCSTIPAG